MQKIPHIVHYIWFGRKPIPKRMLRYISSWKTMLPNYKFMLWNEDTFDISKSCQFVREAYERKQYAFVSDYVRFYVLERYGGIYLDTDVEILKRFDDKILDSHDVVIALDEGGYLSGSTIMATPGNKIIKIFMSHYEDKPFIKSDGSFENEVINTHMQCALTNFGYQIVNKFQLIKDPASKESVALYPDDFFHVRSLTSGKLNRTENSYAIHWHTISWTSLKTRVINYLRIYLFVPIFGDNIYSRLTRILKNGRTSL